MLLPDKHIRIAESLLGLGTFVLEALRTPRTMDELWATLQRDVNDGTYPAHQTLENLVLSIDVLFAMGAVEMSDSGALQRCN
ncbi:ABC-three component system middle component 6 [Variovorax atrisoli]|uniref:ABC-three component system middle component 6 n=1 Tax=Variovorax atrisoli TaxID=3394203 RepID=UPI0011A2CD54|nr:ABC-three component system middle component 6 [Variovorax paradoxus]MDR6524585.1 hypothetical protein [Variovorax paradoxus]